MKELTGLSDKIRGRVVLPSDREYDAARAVWNGAVDRRPAAIVRCGDVADVRWALAAAMEHGLDVAVRGGGHSVSGKSTTDGGLMIDLRPLKRLDVDAARSVAIAQPGLTLGELNAGIEPRGLVTTTGIVSGTGLAGLTLGGGIGWLMGRLGLTCDNLVAAELVTAGGDVVRASEDEAPDLLWGLRGGGGNLGVVTRFELRVHPLEPIVAGMVLHPIERGADVLRFYRDYTAAAPDGLTAYAAVLTSPDGHPMVAIAACWFGDAAEGDRALAPLHRVGPPVVDTIGPASHAAAISMLDEPSAPGLARTYRSGALRELSDDAIDALVEHGRRMTSPLSAVLIEHMHGAAARVPVHATAFAQRDVAYFLLISPQWMPGTDPEPHVAWADGMWDAMRRFDAGGVYVNYLGDEGAARVRAAYGPNQARLAELKRAYDPANVFRLNQNVEPLGVSGPVR
jgi:FAD/FMN-containing dehydrogenase